MNANAIRAWGIAASGAVMAVALAISLQAPPSPEAQAKQITDAAVQSSRPAVVSFVVRFQGSGPIARAQARAARGDVERAAREVEVQLRRQRAFAGLCFDRFTAGGAEIVLRTCAPIASQDSAAVQQTWLSRLRAMRAVAYADANVTAAPGRAPS